MAATSPKPPPGTGPIPTRAVTREAQIELPAGGEAHQRRLEAGRPAGGKELLGVRPWAGRPAHLNRNVEVDVDPAVAGAGVALAATRRRRLGGVEDVGLLKHRRFLSWWTYVPDRARERAGLRGEPPMPIPASRD